MRYLVLALIATAWLSSPITAEAAGPRGYGSSRYQSGYSFRGSSSMSSHSAAVARIQRNYELYQNYTHPRSLYPIDRYRGYDRTFGTNSRGEMYERFRMRR